MSRRIQEKLNRLVQQYNHTDFIECDPISIPHRFQRKEDKEISGLIASLFAWGLRKTIINKTNDFLTRMDHAPFEFVRSFSPIDLKPFLSFKHRTFNGEDAISLLYFLKEVYTQNNSLESFFKPGAEPVYNGLIQLHNYFIGLPSTLRRSHKHIATPIRNSACKRLNMFLRWMVRRDKIGVDFGIWHSVEAKDLIIPLDVHVLRSALELGLIEQGNADWNTAMKITKKLRTFDGDDPVKYDFALFNLSLNK